LTANAVDSTRPDSQESFTSMAIDLAGTYVYVTSSLNTDKWVRQYTVNTDGTLTRLVSGSIATGADPIQIVVAP
jgi:hypothetical protein